MTNGTDEWLFTRMPFGPKKPEVGEWHLRETPPSLRGSGLQCHTDTQRPASRCLQGLGAGYEFFQRWLLSDTHPGWLPQAYLKQVW